MHPFLRIVRFLIDKPVKSQDQIISELDPWALACAVGAMNGSIYGHIGQPGRLTFDLWFQCCQKEGWKRATGVSESEIRDALRSFAQKNQHKHMNQVMQEEQAKRGLPPAVVLGPGESITVSVPLTLKDKA